MENKRLRKFFTKNPNKKQPRSINFSKAFFEIDKALETCIEKISTENQLEASILKPWK